MPSAGEDGTAISSVVGSISSCWIPCGITSNPETAAVSCLSGETGNVQVPAPAIDVYRDRFAAGQPTCSSKEAHYDPVVGNQLGTASSCLLHKKARGACPMLVVSECSLDDFSKDTCSGLCVSNRGVQDRLLASCDRQDYALLGPVSCTELYGLAELLSHDLCRIRWLYVAVQEPYRKGDFSQRTGHALIYLAKALAKNKQLKGLVLRMPQFELDSQQLQRIVSAFSAALQENSTLTSLQFKPPNFFCEKGASFEPLIKV